MPHVTTDDGVKLYYEEGGSGTPVVFVHEFAGDCRSWEPQMRAFARRYRCIAFNARGFPPSDVPDETSHHSFPVSEQARCRSIRRRRRSSRRAVPASPVGGRERSATSTPSAIASWWWPRIA